MDMKVCTKCGPPAQPLENFYKDSRHKDGKQSACKECVRATNKKWKSKNKEHISTYNRQYQVAEIPGMTQSMSRVKKYWNHRCALCREPAETFGLVLPEKFGGTEELYNLIPECQTCHDKKKETDIFFYSTITGNNIGDILSWTANDVELIKKLSIIRERHYSHSFKSQMKMALLKALNLHRHQAQSDE